MIDKEVQGRLESRYARGGYRPLPGAAELVDAGDAVRAVSMALWAHGYYTAGAEGYTPEVLEQIRGVHPVATRDDVLDALALVPTYRRQVDRDELRLIDAARERGVEWDEIGEALGYPDRSAKQSARARRAALARPVRAEVRRYARRRPPVAEVTVRQVDELAVGDRVVVGDGHEPGVVVDVHPPAITERLDGGPLPRPTYDVQFGDGSRMTRVPAADVAPDPDPDPHPWPLPGEPEPGEA